MFEKNIWERGSVLWVDISNIIIKVWIILYNYDGIVLMSIYIFVIFNDRMLRFECYIIIYVFNI